MIVASVKFKAMKVIKYSKDGFELKVLFDDGDDREMTKSVAFDGADPAVESIFSEIKALERRVNRNLHGLDLDDPLESTVIVRFIEEGRSREKMRQFLAKVNEKASSIRAKRDVTGYLDMINQLQRMEFNF